MTKPKSSASSIITPSNFAIHLVNCAQFFSATGVELLYAVVILSPLTRM